MTFEHEISLANPQLPTFELETLTFELETSPAKAETLTSELDCLSSEGERSSLHRYKPLTRLPYGTQDDRGMGKAGKALRQVLEKHGISQNRLAVTMGLSRSTVNQWFHEITDPSAESVTEIIAALEKLNEAAAKEFIALYLGRTALEDESENG